MQYNEAMHELGVWDEALCQREYFPSSALAGHVRSYQLLTGQEKVRHLPPWYLLPDNNAHLIFYLYQRGKEVYHRLRLVGPRSQHKLINRAYRKFTFITSFKPGALWHFCHLPASDFTDVALDANLVFPKLNGTILEQMTAAAKTRDIKKLIHEVELLLLDHLQPNNDSKRFLNALNKIHLEPLIKVRDLANQTGMSERHFRSLCYQFIGHSPKEILQISRFTHSMVLSNHTREWSSIAFEAGYYDQSHMIASFQKMCGTSPEKLFNAQGL